MSDDLVKRLRDPDFGTETTERKLMDKAADRIEELEAQLKTMIAPQVVENMVRLAEPMLSDALAAADKRIEELEGQLQTVLDRETSILRYYDAKLDAAEAKLASLVPALSYEGLRTDEAEAKLTIAMVGLVQSRDELDQYSQNEYPSDHPVHERYRQRDYDANPARIAIAKIKGEQP